MSLTQLAIVNAAATDNPLMLSDGFGLHLLVQPNGSKLWRFRYRFGGRQNMLTFGAFPAVSLATWPKSDIDRFVLARLEREGLTPVDPADKRTLIRRATLDLIGVTVSPCRDGFLEAAVASQVRAHDDRVAALLAGDLQAYLKVPVQAVGKSKTPPRNGWLVTGRITRLNEGNPAGRIIIGLGVGSTKIETETTVVDGRTGAPATTWRWR